MKRPCDPDPMAEASGEARVTPAGAECRINALGNDVLLRAISFLEARQLVQTCVLSRRWRNLWRSVPRINATHHEFDVMVDSEEERSVRIKKFTNALLMLRNPVALDAFRLSYFMTDYQEPADPHADREEDANLWIHHALQSNARNLQTGCAALESLLLSGCGIYDIEISSETLKVLAIDDSSYFTTDKQLSISIPSLSYLGLPASARMPLLKNMGSLVTASVSVSVDSEGATIDGIYQFLRSLSVVTNLDFNFKGTMEIIFRVWHALFMTSSYTLDLVQLKMEKNSQWCPKFNNLTALTLGDCCLSADYVLEIFLQNCPNLVKLTVKPKKCNYTSQTIISKLKGKEGSLTSQNIEILEIECSEGDRNVLEKLLMESGITSWNVDTEVGSEHVHVEH
ncbi:hypothetical protein HU200_042075 [Digitaria exilis]|uniref:F-box domain-containing protein n=1 Tax=Digitaria exilis TaxID=1010633 RepID=A0A835B6L2_9POAL|nr:hypothetical protein HU200_042075 [Digitaria exilis]